jgi:hypothetical protein
MQNRNQAPGKKSRTSARSQQQRERLPLDAAILFEQIVNKILRKNADDATDDFRALYHLIKHNPFMEPETTALSAAVSGLIELMESPQMGRARAGRLEREQIEGAQNRS